MTFGRKVTAVLSVATVVSLLLLLVSGAFTANASPGPIRVHINGGSVVVGHGIACFIQEGNVEADTVGGVTTGTFVANLKVAGGLPDAGGPCGTISGTVTFQAHPHLGGFFGFWNGQVTRHSGPMPEGDFTGDFVTGSWQVNHVSGGSGVTVGEGNINVFG